MMGKIDSQEAGAIPLQAKADGRSGSQHSRRGTEARTDSVHSTSATMQGMSPMPNRPQNLRRRGRSAVNTEAKESESSRESTGGIGAGNTAISTVRDSQPRRRQQQHIPPGDSTGANTLGARKLSSKNPMVRYVVLTTVLIFMGFAVRYLWRQLAGLAGAWLILAAARHWSGERQRDQQDSSVAHHCSPEYPRVKQREESGSNSKPLVASRDQSITAATRVVEAGEDHETREKGELEWNGAFADASSDLQRYWRDVGPDCRFVVRGMNYMSDKKKVPAGPAAMRLVHVDFFAVTSEVFHVASKGRCRNRIAAFVRSFEDRGKTPPFLFILNILIPGTPVVSCVMYWAFDGDRKGGSEVNVAEEARSNDVFIRMMERYAEVPGSGYRKLERVKSSQQDETLESTGDVINSGTENSKNSPEPAEGEARSLEATSGGAAAEGDSEEQDGAGRLPVEDFRNQRFKLIPNIVEGPFIVRRAVGNKPALLGRKLIQRYFRGPGYVETDVDVGSSVIAEKIVSLCRGYARSLTVELGVCLEGRNAEELPEKCVGVIRMVNLDLDGAEPLYDSEPKPSSPPSIGIPTMTDERDNSVKDYGAAEEPGGSDPGAVQTNEPVAEGGPGHVGEVTARA